MRRRLQLHPDSPRGAATGIEVQVERRPSGLLVLIYSVTGSMGDLLFPAPAALARADGLWRHSCFEAFLRPAPAPDYYEFNFSPSARWAAYRFSACRVGMAEATEIGPPRIETRSSADRYQLQVMLDLPRLPAISSWRLGLSAVLEDVNGGKSFWALAHPPGAPDFHHPDCFALELPPTAEP